jgi:hypothetical protein
MGDRQFSKFIVLLVLLQCKDDHEDCWKRQSQPARRRTTAGRSDNVGEGTIRKKRLWEHQEAMTAGMCGKDRAWDTALSF